MTEPVTPTAPAPVLLAASPVATVVNVPAGHAVSIKPDGNQWFDPNWRDFHKLWSMRAQFMLMGFTAAYMIVPAFMSWLPPRVFAVLVMFIVFVGGIFRLMNQKGVDL